jgi:cell division protein FtsW
VTVKKRSPDIWLFAITVALLVIGIFMVFDASYARAGQAKFTGGDSYFFVKRQAVFAMIGLIAMFIAQRIPYWRLKPYTGIFLLLGIIGLGAVFVPGVGRSVNGATRWIGNGMFNIQPSEFAKLGLVLYLAHRLSRTKIDIRSFRSGILPALVPMAVIGALVMAEPDMGTTVITCATGVILMYIAGARKSHMTLVISGALVLGALLILIEPYRVARLITFLNPFADYSGHGYQVCRSLIALGSGGPLGVGLCESREKVFYLPAEHTDFILAVLGEEAGLIGTVGLATLFLLFAIRGFKIARKTKDNFGKFLATGITCLIAGQALLNMLVVTSSVPATGVPLPFISYGGSSLALNLMIVGILLGISQYPNGEEDEDRPYRRRNRGSRLSGY